MTLLEDIQNTAIDASSPMATLLRKCAVLAARLKNAELKSWVAGELNGYEQGVDLPEYRVLPAQAHVNVAGPFGSGYKNLTVPPVALPESVRRFAEEVSLRQSIAAVEAIAQNATTGELRCPWPGDLIVYVQQEGKFAKDLVIYAAWQTISKAQIVGVLDAVRNRVLEFALRLQDEAPTAGEPEKSGSTVPDDKVTQLFQTIIQGDVVGNVSTGNNPVQAIGTLNVDPAVGAALKEMTDAVMNSNELQPAQKTDAVQMLETVASEASLPKDKRRSGTIRAVLFGFAEIVKVGASLSALWEKLGPTIKSAF